MGRLHQFQGPSVGILYNYADPTVGNLQCSSAKMSNARQMLGGRDGPRDGHAWNWSRHSKDVWNGTSKSTWTGKPTVGLWFKRSYKSECLKHHFTAFDTPSLARFIVNSRQFWKHFPSVVSLYQRSLKCSLVDAWVSRPAPPVATSQYTIRCKIVKSAVRLKQIVFS